MPHLLNPTALDRVLLVQTAFLGDALLVAPLVQALKSAGARYVLVVTKDAGADAVREMPGVDDVRVLDKRGGDRGLFQTWNGGAALRPLSLTCALVPHRSIRSALFARATGAPIRVGFHTSAGRTLFTHHVRYHASLPETHRNLALLEPFRLGREELPQPWFVLPQFRTGGGRVRVLIAPGSQWGTKRWPQKRFEELVGRCLSNGWDVVLTGSSSEAQLCRDICRMFVGRPVENLAGATTWEGFRTAISAATVVVANDTAAVHAANAVGVPVVAVFGPTVPEMGFRPRGLYDSVAESYGLHCRPCNSHGAHICPLGTHMCMTDISVEQVHNAVTRVIAATHGTR